MDKPRMDWIKLGLALGLTVMTSATTFSLAISRALELRSRLLTDGEHRQALQIDAGNALVCIAKAADITHTPALVLELRAVPHQCQSHHADATLAAAHELAQHDRLALAIATLQPLIHGPRGAEAQHWIQLWSARILTLAETTYQTPGDRFQDAIRIASAIPVDTPLHPVAQQRIQQWQAEWASNQQTLQTVSQALEQGDLTQAQAAIAQFSAHPHWQAQATTLQQNLQTLQVEEAHWQRVRQIEWFIAAGEPENAVREIQQLPLDAPWAERRVKLLERADARRRQIRFCRIITLRLLSCR